MYVHCTYPILFFYAVSIRFVPFLYKDIHLAQENLLLSTYFF